MYRKDSIHLSEESALRFFPSFANTINDNKPCYNHNTDSYNIIMQLWDCQKDDKNRGRGGDGDK